MVQDVIDTSISAQFRRKFETIIRPSDIGTLFNGRDLDLLAERVHPMDLDLQDPDCNRAAKLIEMFMPQFHLASAKGLFRREAFIIQVRESGIVKDQTIHAIFGFACEQGILESVDASDGQLYRMDPLVWDKVPTVFTEYKPAEIPA